MPALGQSSARRAAAADSLRLLRRAREAQRDFERVRRANLPSELDAGSDRCDERIGRYCYWHETFAELPPPEADVVTRPRERLLRELATAGGRLPGDRWIIGQLVRYLAEHGRADSAIITAQRCRATRWSCDALEGLARHRNDLLTEHYARIRWLSSSKMQRRPTAFSGDPPRASSSRDSAGPRTPPRAVTLNLRRLSQGRTVVTVEVSVAARPRGCSSRELLRTTTGASVTAEACPPE